MNLKVLPLIWGFLILASAQDFSDDDDFSQDFGFDFGNAQTIANTKSTQQASSSSSSQGFFGNLFNWGTNSASTGGKNGASASGGFNFGLPSFVAPSFSSRDWDVGTGIPKFSIFTPSFQNSRTFELPPLPSFDFIKSSKIEFPVSTGDFNIFSYFPAPSFTISRSGDVQGNFNNL